MFIMWIVVAGVVLSSVAHGTTTFVPSAATGPIFSYWTTWYVENYPALVPKGGAAMGDAQLFADCSPSPKAGPLGGWAKCFFPDARSDLLLLLDDTWFVRPSTFANQWQIDPVKFPAEHRGNWSTDAAALVAAARAAGWAGLGVWHHGVLMGNSTGEIDAQFASLAAAGVQHVKTDGTDDGHGYVTASAHRVSTTAKLRIEHKQSPGAPMNGKPLVAGAGRCRESYIDQLVHLVACTDVLRTDDIVCQMSVPTCLDRFARTLAGAASNSSFAPAVPGALGIIAPQDEAYMAAGLSGALAGMRHPLPQLVGDSRINGNRNLTRRMDEVTRATRWFRIAPPTGVFASGSGAVLVDAVPLFDEKVLTKDDTWDSAYWGKGVNQGAPARTTRGLPHLPVVVAADGARYGTVVPFVVASKHPNGALAVAALGRTLEEHGGWIMPRANLTVWAGKPSGIAAVGAAASGVFVGATATELIGVFGAVRGLTIVWSAPPGLAESDDDEGSQLLDLQVWVQDLKASAAVDVSELVVWCAGGTALYINGQIIDEYGSGASSAQTPGDLSDPGVVIALTRGTRRRSRSRSRSRSHGDVAAPMCPVIPSPPVPTPAPTPGPPAPPGPTPAPGPPITPSELNGTWIQASPKHPSIDVIITNGGGDVRVVGHNAGLWTTGTGVVLDNVIDVHCVGPKNFSTHQIGTAHRSSAGGLQLDWVDGVGATAGLGHWAPWTKSG